MSLDSPRRIFNGRQRRRSHVSALRAPRLFAPSRGGMLLLFTLFGVCVAVGGAEHSTAAIGTNPPTPVVRADSGDTAVIDGATLRVGNTVIRIDGLETAERSTQAGQVAIRRLASLVRGRAVSCDVLAAPGPELRGVCRTEAGDLAAAMQAAGRL